MVAPIKPVNLKVDPRNPVASANIEALFLLREIPTKDCRGSVNHEAMAAYCGILELTPAEGGLATVAARLLWGNNV